MIIGDFDVCLPDKRGEIFVREFMPDEQANQWAQHADNCTRQSNFM